MPTKYPYDEWFRGEFIRLRKGVDFTGSAARVARTIRTHGEKHGFSVYAEPRRDTEVRGHPWTIIEVWGAKGDVAPPLEVPRNGPHSQGLRHPTAAIEERQQLEAELERQRELRELPYQEREIRRLEEERLTPSWRYLDPDLEKPEITNQEVGWTSDPERDSMMSWWSEDHDSALASLIAVHEYGWQDHEALFAAVIEVDKPAYERWTETDPCCEINKPRNLLWWFVAGRAKYLGLTELLPDPDVRTCASCGEKFDHSLNSEAHRRALARFTDGSVCGVCLFRALNRANGGMHNATKQQIEQWIRDVTTTLERVPSANVIRDPRLELPGDARLIPVLTLFSNRPSADRVHELYGSWFGALVKSGVLEGSALRLSRGTKCLAEDGHECHSIGEKTIDDLLHRLEIPHEREPPYPVGRYRADFKVGETLIEFFGMTGDPAYDKKTEIKRKLAADHGVDLIEVFPRDLGDLEDLQRVVERIPTGN